MKVVTNIKGHSAVGFCNPSYERAIGRFQCTWWNKMVKQNRETVLKNIWGTEHGWQNCNYTINRIKIIQIFKVAHWSTSHLAPSPKWCSSHVKSREGGNPTCLISSNDSDRQSPIKNSSLSDWKLWSDLQWMVPRTQFLWLQSRQWQWWE